MTERCADVFDENLLNVTLDELQALLNGWLTAIYGNGCGTSYYYYYYYYYYYRGSEQGVVWKDFASHLQLLWGTEVTYMLILYYCTCIFIFILFFIFILLFFYTVLLYMILFALLFMLVGLRSCLISLLISLILN